MSDVRRFWRPGDSTSKRVLDVLEFVYLRLWKIIVQWVAVVKFRMKHRSGDGTGSFEVKIRTKTAKFMNMIIAIFRESRYLVRESEMFVENKTKVASWVSSNQWGGINFGKLLWEADKKKFSFRRVELTSGLDIGWSSQHCTFLGLGYLAVFSNAGSSNSSDVLNDAKFRTFWRPVKIRKGVGEISIPIVKALPMTEPPK